MPLHSPREEGLGVFEETESFSSDADSSSSSSHGGNNRGARAGRGGAHRDPMAAVSGTRHAEEELAPALQRYFTARGGLPFAGSHVFVQTNDDDPDAEEAEQVVLPALPRVPLNMLSEIRADAVPSSSAAARQPRGARKGGSSRLARVGRTTQYATHDAHDRDDDGSGTSSADEVSARGAGWRPVRSGGAGTTSVDLLNALAVPLRTVPAAQVAEGSEESGASGASASGAGLSRRQRFGGHGDADSDDDGDGDGNGVRHSVSTVGDGAQDAIFSGVEEQPRVFAQEEMAVQAVDADGSGGIVPPLRAHVYIEEDNGRFLDHSTHTALQRRRADAAEEAKRQETQQRKRTASLRWKRGFVQKAYLTDQMNPPAWGVATGVTGETCGQRQQRRFWQETSASYSEDTPQYHYYCLVVLQYSRRVNSFLAALAAGAAVLTLIAVTLPSVDIYLFPAPAALASDSSSSNSNSSSNVAPALRVQSLAVAVLALRVFDAPTFLFITLVLTVSGLLPMVWGFADAHWRRVRHLQRHVMSALEADGGNGTESGLRSNLDEASEANAATLLAVRRLHFNRQALSSAYRQLRAESRVRRTGTSVSASAARRPASGQSSQGDRRGSRSTTPTPQLSPQTLHSYSGPAHGQPRGQAARGAAPDTSVSFGMSIGMGAMPTATAAVAAPTFGNSTPSVASPMGATARLHDTRRASRDSSTSDGTRHHGELGFTDGGADAGSTHSFKPQPTPRSSSADSQRDANAGSGDRARATRSSSAAAAAASRERASTDAFMLEGGMLSATNPPALWVRALERLTVQSLMGRKHYVPRLEVLLQPRFWSLLACLAMTVVELSQLDERSAVELLMLLARPANSTHAVQPSRYGDNILLNLTTNGVAGSNDVAYRAPSDATRHTLLAVFSVRASLFCLVWLLDVFL